MYSTVDCPYCGHEIASDDWYENLNSGYAEWQEECPHCKKVFMASAEVEIVCDANPIAGNDDA